MHQHMNSVRSLSVYCHSYEPGRLFMKQELLVVCLSVTHKGSSSMFLQLLSAGGLKHVDSRRYTHHQQRITHTTMSLGATLLWSGTNVYNGYNILRNYRNECSLKILKIRIQGCVCWCLRVWLFCYQWHGSSSTELFLMRQISPKWAGTVDVYIETLSVLHCEDEGSVWLIIAVISPRFDHSGSMGAYSCFITLINFLSDTAAINPPFYPAMELHGGRWLMRWLLL